MKPQTVEAFLEVDGRRWRVTSIQPNDKKPGEALIHFQTKELNGVDKSDERLNARRASDGKEGGQDTSV